MPRVLSLRGGNRHPKRVFQKLPRPSFLSASVSLSVLLDGWFRSFGAVFIILPYFPEMNGWDI